MNLLLLLATIVGYCAFFLRLVCRGSQAHAEVEEFPSADAYTPMVYLFRSEEITFLRAQPGFRPEFERRLRQQRCRAFLLYASKLWHDFDAICFAIRFVMAQSSMDRHDLARLLLRSQVAFAWRMAVLYVNMARYWCGFSTAADAHQVISTYCDLRAAFNLAGRPRTAA